jgi:predicted phage terminase large subunit-like protein
MVATTTRPQTISTVRLARLARLRELQAEQARYDALTARIKARQYRTPGELAAALDPKTVSTPALELLDANLLDVAEGRCERLIWSMAPQEGKSERVSRRFPLWMLLRNPDMRIAIASYDLSMARRWGRRILNDILEHPELGLRVRNDTSAAHDWQLEGHIGGCYSVGIGGPLTGRPVDCLVGSTIITTSSGPIAIQDLVHLPELPLVLSWNHLEKRAQWRKIEASRVISGRNLVEVHTTAGRVVRCTQDHRIYTETRGYIPAAELQPGERLVVTDQSVSEVRPLRKAVHQAEICDSTDPTPRYSTALLSRMPVSRVRRTRGNPAGLQQLRETVPQERNGNPCRETSGKCADVLLAALLRGASDPVTGGRCCAETEDRHLSPMRDEHEPVKGTQVLLARVLAGRELGASASVQAINRTTVPELWCDVPAHQQSYHALLTVLRECDAFESNGWIREFPFQGRHELRDVVPQDETADYRAGSRMLCGLPADPRADEVHSKRNTQGTQRPVGASHQRRSSMQLCRESSDLVQDVPRDTPQIGYDTVSVVERVCGPGELVYDIQVEENCNLFAGEILLHNCLVIDDPLKGRAEADSEVYRNGAWDWWTETARTRLAPHAPVVMVNTRWHELDLSGRLITDDQEQHHWRVVNIPAQCESGDDPLGREPEQYMISARLNPDGSQRTVEQWRQIRRDVGERGWSALYQGRPAPAEGAMLKRAWWRYGTTPAYYLRPDGSAHAHGMDQVIQSWDMAFKDAATSSYVVGQVWGKRGADAFLLDQVRDHMDFPTTCRAVEALSAKWPQASLKLIEDKANGPAVIAQLRKKVPGMVPVSPKDSKEARVAAISPFVEAGNVHLPDPLHTPWVDGFVSEASQFPTGTHDDQVDALTQAVSRLLLLGGSSTDFLNQLTSQAS